MPEPDPPTPPLEYRFVTACQNDELRAMDISQQCLEQVLPNMDLTSRNRVVAWLRAVLDEIAQRTPELPF